MAMKQSKMPTGPASRLLSLGGLALASVGTVVGHGARQVMSGRTPDLPGLIFSAQTGTQVAQALARMRGAAMKVGQILSMDSGDLLPRPFSEALSQLQQAAYTMPRPQLEQVLNSAWGTDWRGRFNAFDMTPIAAASIGQVHKATLTCGRPLAIKVQFPDVRKSIDSDVANISTLLKTLGVSATVKNLSEVIEATRVQLHHEADYLLEADYMSRYGTALRHVPPFLVPAVYEPLTRMNILAMDFMQGEDIETVCQASQSVRDEVTESLFKLALTELFDLGLMQTDPNFANYRWVPKTRQIVLLDFGATRPIGAETRTAYKNLMMAGLVENQQALKSALIEIGVVSPEASRRYSREMATMMDIMIRHFGKERLNFADRSFVPLLKAEIGKIAQDRSTWQLPTADVLFVQRKLSGTAMFGVRARASLPLRRMVAQSLAAGPSPA